MLHLFLRILPRSGAWVKADPATDFIALVDFGLAKIFAAFEATVFDVVSFFDIFSPHCTSILGRRCCSLATKTRRPALLENEPAAPKGATRQKSAPTTVSPVEFSPSIS